MRRLVVAHHEKGLVFGLGILHEIDGLVSDNVRSVSRFKLGAVCGDQLRIEVGAVIAQDGPLIEAAGLVVFAFSQMPFAENAGGVAAERPHLLGQGWEARVDLGSESVHQIDMIMDASKYGGS